MCLGSQNNSSCVMKLIVWGEFPPFMFLRPFCIQLQVTADSETQQELCFRSGRHFQSFVCIICHLHHHLSLNREGCWGITNDFTTSFLHFSLLSTAVDLLNSRPVHSLMWPNQGASFVVFVISSVETESFLILWCSELVIHESTPKLTI